MDSAMPVIFNSVRYPTEWKELHVGMAVVERFPLIQYVIENKRDDLLGYIALWRKGARSQVTLEAQNASDEDMLSNAQTKLGSTTKR